MFEFRWLTRFALAIGLIGALVAAPSVGGTRLINRAEAMSAQSVPGTWVSGVTVLNPSTNPAAANVTVNFYDPTGALISGAVQTAQVAVGGTQFWYVPSISGLSTNTTYSAVVSADQQVYATVNLTSGSPASMGETYNGVDTTQVATTASYPSTLRSYYGFTSNLVVQNTGATNASVTVTFAGKNGAGPVSLTTNSVTIAPNASFTFDLGGDSSGTNYGTLGTGFTGAATVNGGGNNVAVIANTYTPSQVPTLAAGISGYLFSSANATTATSGATTVFVPALYKNYYGYVSALTVENVGTVATNATVTYSDGVVDSSCTNIAPNNSCLLYTPNNASILTGFVGSATITSSAGQPLVAVVNVQGTPGTPGALSGGLASYNGFANGFLHVFAPGLLVNYHGYSSALTIQNVDTVTAPAGSITVSYSNSTDVVTNPTALAPGAPWVLFQPNDPKLGSVYNGGATVASTTAHVVGVINIEGAPSSDQLFSTTAFGQ